MDLSGLTLQQLVQDFPVCMYRFPPGTLLAPRHHVTVRPAACEPSQRRWDPLPPNPATPLPRAPGLG